MNGNIKQIYTDVLSENHTVVQNGDAITTTISYEHYDWHKHYSIKPDMISMTWSCTIRPPKPIEFIKLEVSLKT